MNHSRATISELSNASTNLEAGLNKPRPTIKGKRGKIDSTQAIAKQALVNVNVNISPEQAAESLTLWPTWPAAGIERQGKVHTTNAKVLQTLKPILLQKAGKPVQLVEAANRRLWQLVSQDQSQDSGRCLTRFSGRL